jgi:predicted enzyme related to lactoylglutathione lyase
MPTHVIHVEIPAGDTAAAREFWGKLFGLEFQAFPGSPSEYHMTRLDDRSGAAITNMEPGKKGMRPYFDVPDIGAGVARIKELGGEASDPMPVPNMGWFVTATDPHGNEFGLWQTDTSASMPE